MRICFWGTRGSYPASFSAKELSLKLDIKGLQVLPPGLKALNKQEPLEAEGLAMPSTYGTNTSCVHIDPGLENEHILCDAGTGIIEFIEDFLIKLPSAKPQTFHIFLSHLHWDHILGFPFFALKVPPQSHIIIHAHHDKTEPVLKGLLSTPVFPVAFKNLDAKVSFDVKKPGSSFRIANVKVSSFMQNHPGISYGYRFEQEGKRLIYSTDCEHPKGDYAAGHPFIEFCKQADILIFDAMSSLAEVQQRGWGHSTYKVGIELALWARAKHVLFFHHDPSLKDEQLNYFLNLARAYKGDYLKTAPLAFPSEPLKLSMAFDTLSMSI
jgi:phosphoribosyl 1,2-cyclic phosphodiesterase